MQHRPCFLPASLDSCVIILVAFGSAHQAANFLSTVLPPCRCSRATGRPRPAASPSQDAIDPAPYLRLLQRIDSEVPVGQRGDLLVFVAGVADIAALVEGLTPYALQTRRCAACPQVPLDASCRSLKNV